MTETSQGGKPLTGRTVLIITLCAFGVIIGVNVLMITLALQTFPGNERENGYVASHNFETERAVQARLGWMSSARYEDGRVAVSVTDRQGAPAPIESLRVRIGRPANDAEDVTPPMILEGARWTAETPLGPGLWRVDLAAVGLKGESFRQKLTLRVREP